MENQTFLAPSRGEIGEALLRLCYGTDEHVQSGYYCALTICSAQGQRTVHLPRRVLLWVLTNLGPAMTECQADVVAKGHAQRLEYRDMKNEAYVLGTYALADCAVSIRGVLDYVIKNRNSAIRLLEFRVKWANRLAAERDAQRAESEVAAQPVAPRRTYEQALNAQVEAGQLVAFIVCRGEREESTPVSQRAAVWLLQALEGKLENYEPDAVAQGDAVRIEYQYGTHRAVLGTYSRLETYGFFRGLMGYCKRKYKDAIRKAWACQRREAAKKGGATL